MRRSFTSRKDLGKARRIVVKIGSRVLCHGSGRLNRPRVRALVGDIGDLHDAGLEVVLVTSGAIGAGMEALGMRRRPVELVELQMAAAVGQCRLMAEYDERFAIRRIHVGQVLLTHDNFEQPVRRDHAHHTIMSLLRHRVVPIINENDVVSVEELRAKLGDNDTLATLVADLVSADLLVMLTASDGFREPTTSGRSRRVSELGAITRKTHDMVRDKSSHLATGGMGAKLNAAKAAVEAGSAVVIADGRKDGILGRIMNGDDTGTFIANSAPKPAREIDHEFAR